MANFGFSVGDIVTVGSLAWNVYRACSNASSEFQEVAREVVSLHTAVKQLEVEADKPGSIVHNAIDSQQKEFALLIRNVEEVLKQLDHLVSKYKSLGTENRKKRDVLRFSSQGLEDIRSKIILHTSNATLFIGTLSAASLGRIELKLDEIVNELRNGKRNTAAIAVSDDEDDPAAVKQWRTLRKELVSDGFQQDDIESHKAWIKAEMRKRIANGDGGPSKKKMAMNIDSSPPASPIGYLAPPHLSDAWSSMPQTTSLASDPPGNSSAITFADLRHPFGPPLPQACVNTSSVDTHRPIPSNSLASRTKLQPTTASGAAESASFQDALDASRGMVAMSLTDITPRNVYANSARTIDPYGFPIDDNSDPGDGSRLRRSPSVSSMSSVHSDVAEYDQYGNMTKRVVTTTTTTYYSASMSESSDRDLSSPRTLPRSDVLSGGYLPPAPQSMMGQFTSKFSSSSQKKHKCKVCDKRFTRESSLQTHMYSHTGEKPFACDFEGCGRHFSVVSNLRRHKKVHKDEERELDNDADSES